MIDEREKPVLEALRAMGIAFERFEHPAAATMEECEAVAAEAGAYHCKNLFLTNKRGTEFCLLLLDRRKPFRTAAVSKLLNSTRLSFASEEQLFARLGLLQGSVSAAGLLNAAKGSVRVAIDADILREEEMLIHPNVNTASIRLRTADLLLFLERLGCAPEIIEIEPCAGVLP